ncbi:hypothetical protein V8E36_008050 [Tilletia maclaganii]
MQKRGVNASADDNAQAATATTRGAAMAAVPGHSFYGVGRAATPAPPSPPTAANGHEQRQRSPRAASAAIIISSDDVEQQTQETLKSPTATIAPAGRQKRRLTNGHDGTGGAEDGGAGADKENMRPRAHVPGAQEGANKKHKPDVQSGVAGAGASQVNGRSTPHRGANATVAAAPSETPSSTPTRPRRSNAGVLSAAMRADYVTHGAGTSQLSSSCPARRRESPGNKITTSPYFVQQQQRAAAEAAAKRKRMSEAGVGVGSSSRNGGVGSGLASAVDENGATELNGHGGGQVEDQSDFELVTRSKRPAIRYGTGGSGGS